MKTLFDHAREKLLEKEQPLAARMRPRTLAEYVGQSHILAPGRLLRRAIQADQLSSLIFYGPPGTGKTTLAAVIANTTRSHFTVLNAVLAGKADIRTAIEEAQRRLGEQGRRTILFVDEVHRWNKAQQDALLPWVENGTLILIGATTENPYFSVNRALVSRSRVFQLKKLDEQDLSAVAEACLQDSERGYGSLNVRVAEDAMRHLIRVAGGDARALLNALELAVETTPPAEDGAIHVDLAVAEDSIQQRAVLYDQEGDYHFDIISAFIKSLRGSDPDAAVYWLAKMVYAGEDPRFLFRRMLIFAGEDIGLADPGALGVVVSAAAAFDRVGMPEGRYHLGMAALYLATAPKSNSVFAFFDALAAVEKEEDAEVPNHLRDASRDKESFGHGRGYLYPHAYRDHWVAQQYLPTSLQGRVFYQPGSLGYEAGVHDEVLRRREAQIASFLESDATGFNGETLTYTPGGGIFDAWLERAMGGTAKCLEDIRKVLFEIACCRRHHTVLVLADDAGLVVWEAVRQTPEGGVWCQVERKESRDRIVKQAEDFPDLRSPAVIHCAHGALEELRRGLEKDLRFDRILSRNLLRQVADPAPALARMSELLAPGGLVVLAEPMPERSRRLHEILPLSSVSDVFRQAVVDHEEKIAGEKTLSIEGAATQAALTVLTRRVVESISTLTITDTLLDRWFGAGNNTGGGTYSAGLAHVLPHEEIAALAAASRRNLRGKSVKWQSATEVAALKADAL